MCGEVAKVSAERGILSRKFLKEILVVGSRGYKASSVRCQMGFFMVKVLISLVGSMKSWVG